MVRSFRLTIVAAVIAAAGLNACGGGGGGGSVATAQPSASSSSSSTASGPGDPVINEVGGIPTGYSLVWNDEFSIDGLPDATRWRYDTARNKVGWHNNEKQYYAAARLKNTRVEGGQLIIEAHKETLNLTDFPDWGGQAYSSARMVTDTTKTFTYGFVEVRAKLPCQIGSWPAIWTLAAPPYTTWPDDGEVDIMEHTGSKAGQIQHSTHTKNYYWVTNTQKTTFTTVPDACDAFHLYQMTWTKDYIKLGVDNRNYMIYRNDGSGNYGNWPYFHPQYVILNLAVGGDYVGPQGINDASFPWQFRVDYVRIYQAP